MNWNYIWERLKGYLGYLETERIRDLILQLDREAFIFLLGGTAILVILCFLKGMVRLATFILALCATTVLLHFTVPEPGVKITASQLVGLFLGGTFIVATTIYVIFIKTD
jgi:hypothetical protein